MSIRRWALAGASLVLTIALVGQPLARASLPGRNGLIAFVLGRNGDHHIFAIRADGTGLRRITWGPSRDAAPAWSPDGRTIAFTRINAVTGRPGVYLVRSNGFGLRRLTPPRILAGYPTWAPGGRRLAFACARHRPGSAICVINRDGTGLHRITALNTRNIRPVWSPNGRWIAYSSTDGNRPFQVWRMHPNGTRKTRVTNTAFGELSFDWAPDGSRILITCFVPGVASRADVFTVRPTGADMHRLTYSKDGTAAAWSPNGGRIAFVAGGALAVMTADGLSSWKVPNVPTPVVGVSWQRR
jgi:Tol biopolymer transport system component